MFLILLVVTKNYKTQEFQDVNYKDYHSRNAIEIRVNDDVLQGVVLEANRTLPLQPQ